jgi:hypothetical protein
MFMISSGLQLFAVMLSGVHVADVMVDKILQRINH